jgi:hypothetical protein
MSNQDSTGLLIECYLRAIVHQLGVLQRTPVSEEDSLLRVQLFNSIRSINEVAEVCQYKYPVICTRILKEIPIIYAKHSHLVTDSCRAQMGAFEDALEQLLVDTPSLREQQLVQHYKFLRQFDELAVAACLVGDLDTLDSLVVKLEHIKRFVDSVAGLIDISPTHLKIIRDFANKAFQMAVDASLSLSMIAQYKQRTGMV